MFGGGAWYIAKNIKNLLIYFMTGLIYFFPRPRPDDIISRCYSSITIGSCFFLHPISIDVISHVD